MDAAVETSLLRSRDGQARVTYVELFFDLVFVFAITQLSHALLADLTPLGALRTLVLFLAVWWAWVNTAWVTNWLDPDRGATRLLLFVLMVCGMLAAMSIPHAYDRMGLVFALAYVAVELSRSAFMVWASQGNESLRRNFQRILAWQAATAPFWLIGAAVEDTARLGAWVLALGIWTAAPTIGFRVPGLGRSTTADWDVDGGHLAERCALFVIIALGESLLVTGATFGELEWTPGNAAAFLVALAGSIAMWWIYFHIGAERSAHHAEKTDDPGHLARLGYTYLHMPIVAGIVVAAVGDERVLHHPGGHAEPGDVATLLGAPALYLAGLAAFKRLSAANLPLSHLAGLGLLACLAVVGGWLSPLLLAALAAATLVLVAAWEHVSLKGTRQA
ncbi:low temperature requirement protein A [Falsiroseomonas sp. HW251]|uniref:low temperature requirement protein A n=1 Tax=Falsiroseomonas sp. HW251 TaxID=3390998 RepID=UPI003D3215B7